ncbi:hypothetical protein HK096_005545 [Nowakowskiella sp. JEL0078]|nr:hypothetical protein HK096_005545 [Nowakowskiella sp. JEL0078]
MDPQPPVRNESNGKPGPRIESTGIPGPRTESTGRLQADLTTDSVVTTPLASASTSYGELPLRPRFTSVEGGSVLSDSNMKSAKTFTTWNNSQFSPDFSHTNEEDVSKLQVPHFIKRDLEKNMSISKFSQFLSVFHLKNSPMPAGQYRLGPQTFWQWKSSFLLCLILITIAVVFNSFVSIIAPVKTFLDTQGKVCSDPQNFLTEYKNKFLSLTNLTVASQQADYAFNISTMFFSLANKTHQPIAGEKYRWPQPFLPSENDTARLQAQANRVCYTEKCQDITVDTSGTTKTVCTNFQFPCADPTALKALSASDVILQQSQLFNDGRYNNTNQTSTTSTSLQNSAFTKTVIDQLIILQQRVNLVGSIYVLWLAISIYIGLLGSPFNISSPRWTTKVQTWIGGISKLHYTVFVILTWYVVEYVLILINIPEFQIIIPNIEVNPCWLDSTLVSKFYQQTTDLCSNIVDAKNKYNNAYQSMQFYASVEKTWTRTPPGQPAAYPTNFTSLNLIFTGQTCTDVDVFTHLLKPPADAPRVNIGTIILKTGILAQFFLQPVLAHLVISSFQILFPLSTNAGRVMLPMVTLEALLNNKGLPLKQIMEKSVYHFVRLRNILPLVIHSGILTLVCYGLISQQYLALFVFFVFSVVALLALTLYFGLVILPRKESRVLDLFVEETTAETNKMDEKEYDQYYHNMV